MARNEYTIAIDERRGTMTALEKRKDEQQESWEATAERPKS
jgi:hypothetical protein